MVICVDKGDSQELAGRRFRAAQQELREELEAEVTEKQRAFIIFHYLRDTENGEIWWLWM